MLKPQIKLQKVKKLEESKRHATATLEKVALASWISYKVLLGVCSRVVGTKVKDIGELSIHQLRKVQKEIKEKGWKLRNDTT